MGRVPHLDASPVFVDVHLPRIAETPVWTLPSYIISWQDPATLGPFSNEDGSAGGRDFSSTCKALLRSLHGGFQQSLFSSSDFAHSQLGWRF